MSLPRSLSGIPKMQAWLRRMPRSILSWHQNQDTLAHLDAYLTMRGGDKMAHMEIIQDQLHRIPYVQMLVYLKQGKLSELAR